MLLDGWSLLEANADWVPPSHLSPPPRTPAPRLQSKPPRRLPTSTVDLTFTWVGSAAVATTGRHTFAASAELASVAAYGTANARLTLDPQGASVAAYAGHRTQVAVTVTAVDTRRVVTPLVDDDVILALLMED